MANAYIEGLNPDAPKWKRDDTQRVIDNFKTEAIVDTNGVVKWERSGNFPPTDILELWQHLGFEFNFEATIAAKEEHDREFFANYRKQMANHKPSAEEMFEMKAAFGEGTTVVNVITGKKTKL